MAAPSPGSPQPRRESAFEEALVACLSRMESEGEPGLDGYCREHPELEGRLRKRVQLLRQAGLLGSLHEEREDFPEQLGDFRLIERLGAGGMGVVYLAEQTSLGRRVALKLIRPEHLYFPRARSRFAREVEAVSRLAHPGIVPVHVVGEESGIPYFAMEFVRGASLDRVLQELRERAPAELRGADLRAVVERAAGCPVDPEVAAAPPFGGGWTEACLWIAREVAQALEHAHQRGVLHRDVKPSNVMLTPAGRVLLVDFGLASSEGSRELTRTGSQLGSLPYMAPEQVEGERNRIEPRTDVYGLGVTLHQLLALRLPFEAETGEGLRKQVLAGRPPALRTHAPHLGRDVAAVVAVAMAPEPERRYASAADMARDLTRLLEHRPVEARPAGPWLQLVRWSQRNRAAAAAAALALAVAVLGPLLFGFQQMRLSRRIEEQRRLAEDRRVQAEDERARAEQQSAIAQEQRGVAEEQRRLAEASLSKALEAVEVMLSRIGEQRLSNVPQMERVRRELLQEARAFYAQLDELAGGSPEVQRTRANVGLALAALDEVLGNGRASVAGLREQVEVLEGLLAEDPEDALSRAMLGLALTRLATPSVDRGDAAEALGLLGRAEVELDASGIDSPEMARTRLELLWNRSRALTLLGRVREAIEVTESAVSEGKRWCGEQTEDRDLCRVLAALLSEQGKVLQTVDPPRAAAAMERSLEVYRALVAEDPLDGLVRANLCQTTVNLGNVHSLLGDHERSLAIAREGERSTLELLRDFPTMGIARATLGVLRVNIAVELGTLERREESLAVIEGAEQVFEQIAREQPDDVENLHRLGAALATRGAVLHELGRTAEAEPPLRRAIELHRRAVAAAPRSPFFRYQLGSALLSWAAIEVSRAQYEAAGDALDEALPLLVIDPAAQHRLARSWMEAGLAAEADEELDRIQRGAFLERCDEGALLALEAAVEGGFRDARDLGESPLWEPLRDAPRFEAVLSRAAD